MKKLFIILSLLCATRLFAQTVVLHSTDNLATRVPIKNETVLALSGPGTNYFGQPRAIKHYPSAADAVDNVYVFSAADGGRYIAIDKYGPLLDVRAAGVTETAADNTAAILKAETVANTFPRASKTLYFPPGQYTNLSAVYINHQIAAAGATFWGTNSSDGLILGAVDPSGTNIISGGTYFLPSIRVPSTYRNHGSNLFTGLTLAGIDGGEIHLASIDSYTYGLRVNPAPNDWLAFPHFVGGKISNAKVGVDIYSSGYPAFATQARFTDTEVFSPAFRYGTNAAGYFGVRIDQDTSGWTDANGWKFDHISIEGGAWENETKIRGRNNVFTDCRFETGTPNTPRFLFWSDGSETYPTMYNHIFGNFFSKHYMAVYTEQGTAVANGFRHEAYEVKEGYTPILGDPTPTYNPMLSMRNVGGGPTLGIFDSAVSPYDYPTNYNFAFERKGLVARRTNDSLPNFLLPKEGSVSIRPPTGSMALSVYAGTNTLSVTDGSWGVGLNDNYVYLKNPADANPRIYARGNDGTLGWTDGTNPTDLRFYRSGAGALSLELGAGGALAGLAGLSLFNLDSGDSGAYQWNYAYGHGAGLVSYSVNHSSSLLKGASVWRAADANTKAFRIWGHKPDQQFDVVLTDPGSNTVYALTVTTNGIWTPKDITIYTTNVLTEINNLYATKLNTNLFWSYLSNFVAQGSNINLTKTPGGPLTINSTATGGGGTTITNLGYLALYSGGVLASNTTTETTVWDATIPSNSITLNLPIETTTPAVWNFASGGYYKMRLYVGKSGVVTNKVFEADGFVTGVGISSMATFYEVGFIPKSGGYMDGHINMRGNYTAVGTVATVGFGSLNDGYVASGGFTNAAWAQTNDLYLKLTVQNSVASTNQYWTFSPGAIITGSGSGGGGSGGTTVTVDSGASMTAANFQDSSEVNITQSGNNVSAALIDGSVATNRLSTAAISYLLSRANHTGTEGWSVLTGTPTTRSGYGITDAQPLMGWTNILAGTNIVLRTNLNVLYVDSLGSTSSLGTNGFTFTVNGGSPMSAANAKSTATIAISQSSTNWQADVKDTSLGTNVLTSSAYLWFLNRTNHYGNQNWTTISSTPTTLAGYGITDGQKTMLFTNVVGGTNITATLAGNVLTISESIGQKGTNVIVNGNLIQPAIFTNDIASTGGIVWRTNAAGHILAYATNVASGGGGGLGTNIFVNNVLKQPAKLTNSATVTWSVNGNGDIEAAASGVAGGYLPLSAGYTYPLTGSLDIWPSTRAFISLWNQSATMDSFGLEMSSDTFSINRLSTNTLSVQDTYFQVDASGTPVNIKIPGGLGPTHVFTVDPKTTFNNDVLFGTTNIVTALVNKQPLSTQLTTDANNTGGTSTNFRAGDGTFKQVTTNMVPGLNALIAAQEPLNANKYQATNANLTTLAGGNGSPLTTGIAASAITSGTINNGRLGSEVATTTNANSFSASQTFLSTATFGGMPLSYWFGSPLNAREWEPYRATFNGSSVATSASAAGLTQQNVNGGSFGITASTSPGHPGVVYAQSAANNGAGGTGSFQHWFFNAQTTINTDNIFVAVWQAYNTNGVFQKAGWDLSLTISDPTDACRVVATNGVAVFQNINNSTKTNSSPFILSGGNTVWNTLVIYHTNNSPLSAFYNYTNGVLNYSEVVPGFPTNRVLGTVFGALGVSSPATNSATTLMLIDDIAAGICTKGYR